MNLVWLRSPTNSSIYPCLHTIASVRKSILWWVLYRRRGDISELNSLLVGLGPWPQQVQWSHCPICHGHYHRWWSIMAANHGQVRGAQQQGCNLHCQFHQNSSKELCGEIFSLLSNLWENVQVRRWNEESQEEETPSRWTRGALLSNAHTAHCPLCNVHIVPCDEHVVHCDISLWYMHFFQCAILQCSAQ